MGTPEFAVPTLQALLDHEFFEVVLVVAQPDKPSGRGQQLQSPPTINLARKYSIPTLQPVKVKGKEFKDELAKYNPDLAVVVAYGRILTESILSIPKFGCINVHGSLLPKYRGASPIHSAILNGEKETGITTMQMDAGMDTGDILLQNSIPITEYMTSGELHDILKDKGASLLIKTLEDLSKNKLSPIKQANELASYTTLLSKDDGKIIWSKTSEEIQHHICATTPWPGAFTNLNGKRFVILSGKAVGSNPNHKNDLNTQNNGLDPQNKASTLGSIVYFDKTGISVLTKNGIYKIEQLKPENSRPMSVESFLCGYKLKLGDIFS